MGAWRLQNLVVALAKPFQSAKPVAQVHLCRQVLRWGGPHHSFCLAELLGASLGPSAPWLSQLRGHWLLYGQRERHQGPQDLEQLAYDMPGSKFELSALPLLSSFFSRKVPKGEVGPASAGSASFHLLQHQTPVTYFPPTSSTNLSARPILRQMTARQLIGQVSG